MSKMQDLFRSEHVCNSYDICRLFGGVIYISYHAAVHGRCSSSAKWVVVGAGIRTDPGGPWYNYGNKTFLGRKDSKEREEAFRWASETYKVKDWARDPWGNWQDAEVMKRAIGKIKQASKIAAEKIPA
jgi:hypothetical protein